MTQLIIICVSCLASVFLIIFGAATNNAGTMSTGTGILGALLGAAGVKYEPTINAKVRAFFHVK